MDDEYNQLLQQQWQRQQQQQQQEEEGGGGSIHQQQQKQDKQEAGNSTQQQQQHGGQDGGSAAQQQYQQQQQQQNPLVQLLLACAPDVAALPQHADDVPSYNSTLPRAERVGALWSQIVAAAPDAVSAVVERTLLEQLFDAASGSSSSSSNGREATGLKTTLLKQPCWGCCINARSFTNNRPISTSSATQKAALLLHALQEAVMLQAGHHFADADLGWQRILDPNAEKTLDLTSDPTAADALLKLQQALLLQLATRIGSIPNSVRQMLHAALEQQLQAALKGSCGALQMNESFIGKWKGRQALLQHVPVLVAVLKAEPWLQAQQRQQRQQQQQQQECHQHERKQQHALQKQHEQQQALQQQQQQQALQQQHAQQQQQEDHQLHEHERKQQQQEQAQQQGQQQEQQHNDEPQQEQGQQKGKQLQQPEQKVSACLRSKSCASSSKQSSRQQLRVHVVHVVNILESASLLIQQLMLLL
jgi:hypothetical protein